MGLGFINGAYNAASGTLGAFDALSDRLVREGYPRMVSRSGDREYADQLRIWNERMVRRADIDGRRVYGSKWWNGQEWFQIHPSAVAVPTNPPTSNHGKRRANDLTWPYNSMSTAAWKRARVLGSIYGITCEGLKFREPWHWTFWGALGSIVMPAGKATELQEDEVVTEDDMKQIAATVWNYAMDGGAELSGGIRVPNESGGERLRQVRRSTHQLRGRTLRIEAQNTALTAAVAALAASKGVDAAEIRQTVEQAVSKALAGIQITLTTESD